MKYSFVVPTYNEEGYIVRCLQSIRDQRYDRAQYEVIVSDSNSTDMTREHATPLCDKILTTQKRGIALGRNLGAAGAVGEYLVFVDADAILEQNFLVHLDASFRDQATVGATGVARPSDGNFFQRFVYTGTYLLVRFFSYVGLPLFPGICVAYRGREYKQLGGFREDFGVVEDLDLSRRISKLGHCVVNRNAVAYVSTRRLGNHALSTVLFHIFNDIRYLLTGKAARTYPKHEELKSWKDLWRSGEKPR